MQVKKFGIILFVAILATSIVIAAICKVVETNVVEFESEVYQSEVTLNSKDKVEYAEKNTTTTTKPTTTKKPIQETSVQKIETTTIKKPTTTKQPTTQQVTTKKENHTQSSSNNSIKGSLDFGSDEALMLHKIAIAEAGGESVESMALVMLVVLNRTYDNRFPDSIYGVLHQKSQFTPMVDGSYAKAQPNAKSHKAMELIISGWDESKGALYFESCKGSSWHSRNLTYLFTEGGHKFYK